MDNAKTTIYFDSSDPSNVGFAYRTRHDDDSEDSGAVDGLAGEAAAALVAGAVPTQDGLDDIRNAFGPDVVLDGVGEIFPGWDQ